MDGVVMEGETAETLGVVRLLRRAGELAWVRAEAEGPRSPRQLVALGIDLAAGEARNLLRERVDVVGPTPIGMTRSVCCGRLSSCCARSPVPAFRLRGMRLVLGCGWRIWCGRRTLVPAPDRRTPAELLADKDELARLTLLEVSGQRAPAMLRDFPELVDAAARMWSVLPTASHSGVSGPDPFSSGVDCSCHRPGPNRRAVAG